MMPMPFTVTPISPADVGRAKAAHLPDFVIETWNRLIATKAGSNGTARITKDEAIAAFRPYGGRMEVIKSGWLDIEPIYRDQGWSVKFDAPDYTENYAAYYLFTPRR